jgi:hypothetical protein
MKDFLLVPSTVGLLEALMVVVMADLLVTTKADLLVM